jgi:hypothetical protein
MRTHSIKRMSWLRKARVEYALWRYPAKKVRHRYGSEEFEIEIKDPLAEGWYDHDWDELPEIAVLRRHALRPGARVFDIGAHQCVVAMLLAREVGPLGTVLAVEWIPELHGDRRCYRSSYWFYRFYGGPQWTS